MHRNGYTFCNRSTTGRQFSFKVKEKCSLTFNFINLSVKWTQLLAIPFLWSALNASLVIILVVAVCDAVSAFVIFSLRYNKKKSPIFKTCAMWDVSCGNGNELEWVLATSCYIQYRLTDLFSILQKRVGCVASFQRFLRCDAITKNEMKINNARVACTASIGIHCQCDSGDRKKNNYKWGGKSSASNAPALLHLSV